MGIQIIKEKSKFELEVNDNLNDLIYIRRVLELWLEKLNISEFKIMIIKLCLEEAINNGIMHAYKNMTGVKKRVNCHVEKTKNKIMITVQDHGNHQWYNEFKFPDPDKYAEKLITKGRGLLLIKRLAQDLRIINNKKKGTLIIIKIQLDEDNILKYL